jgi:hypothetical protein
MNVKKKRILFTLRYHNANELRELNGYDLNEIRMDYKCQWTRHLLILIDIRSP